MPFSPSMCFFYSMVTLTAWCSASTWEGDTSAGHNTMTGAAHGAQRKVRILKWSREVTLHTSFLLDISHTPLPFCLSKAQRSLRITLVSAMKEIKSRWQEYWRGALGGLCSVVLFCFFSGWDTSYLSWIRYISAGHLTLTTYTENLPDL